MQPTATSRKRSGNVLYRPHVLLTVGLMLVVSLSVSYVRGGDGNVPLPPPSPRGKRKSVERSPPTDRTPPLLEAMQRPWREAATVTEVGGAAAATEKGVATATAGGTGGTTEEEVDGRRDGGTGEGRVEDGSEGTAQGAEVTAADAERQRLKRMFGFVQVRAHRDVMDVVGVTNLCRRAVHSVLPLAPYPNVSTRPVVCEHLRR
jgi:hypothetical protein